MLISVCHDAKQAIRYKNSSNNLETIFCQEKSDPAETVMILNVEDGYGSIL